MKTEVCKISVLNQNDAIRKVREWNKDKKKLRILSVAPFQKDDVGYEVTIAYEEEDIYCNKDCESCDDKILVACLFACGINMYKCGKDIISDEFSISFPSPV